MMIIMLPRFLAAVSLLLFACGNEPVPVVVTPTDTGISNNNRDAGDAGINDGDTTSDGATTDGATTDGSTSDSSSSDGSSSDGPSSDGSTSDGSSDGGSFPDAAPPDTGLLPITPLAAQVALGGEQLITLSIPPGNAPIWQVDGVTGGTATTGTITAQADPREAIYSAPRYSVTIPFNHEVRAEVGSEYAISSLTLVLPAPTITSITPAQVDVGAPMTTVTISGSGFTPQSRVTLDGVVLPKRHLDWHTLETDVPASFFSFAGERPLAVTNQPPGGGSADTILAVMLHQTVIDPTLPPGIDTLFDNAVAGTDPARLPTITYPEEGAVAPRNFPAPLVSWDHPAPSNVCRLSYRCPAASVHVYTAVPNRPEAWANTSTTVDLATWSNIVGTTLQELDVSLTVACAEVVTSGGPPAIADGKTYASTTIRYVISPDYATGRLVYFSGLIEGMWRIDLGTGVASGQPFIGPDPSFALDTSPRCVGCHSFSGDGSRMAFISDAVVWNLGIANVSGGVPTMGLDPANGALGDWTSIHPSLDVVLTTTLNAEIALLDAVTGQQLALVPTSSAGIFVTHPTWSPRGDAFAFVAGQIGADGVADFADGQIYTMDATHTSGSNFTFGAPVLLASPHVAGGSAYYPAYSPDGDFVIFSQAASGSSYNNPLAEVWIVRADGTTPPVRLTSANRTGPIANSWPRWAPQIQGNRYWIAFSSQRPYPPFNGTGPQQLWLSRVDTSLLPQDPSAPAVWINGQEPFSGNLTTEWTVDR